MDLFRIILVLLVLITLPAHAKDAACIDAGAGDSECVPPFLGTWDTWRFVLSETVGPARDDEASALADAIAVLGESFRCGLSYTQESTAYVATAKRWSWTIQEESTILHYVGLADSTNRNCSGQLLERAGSIRIRRERKISCPRHFNWLIQGEKPGVCVRD